MAARKKGTGAVEEAPKGSGKYRVRARIKGKITTIAGGLTLGEANEIADAYSVIHATTELREGITLTVFGSGFLDRRERRGLRDVQNDRSTWKLRVDKTALGKLPVASITRGDVVRWRDDMVEQGLGKQTILNALNLLRVAFQEACDREITPSNVARDVKLGATRGRADDAELEEDLECILTPEEQVALLRAIPKLQDRAFYTFVLATGLRPSEAYWLRPDDLHVDEQYVLVRRSRKGRATKNGKPRRVPLLPPALEALAMTRINPHYGKPWVWPSERGCRRCRAPSQWRTWLELAGVQRAARWVVPYDLRHTCATSLLAGWWGQPWRLEEVSQFLGHSSIVITERYARKLSATTQLAAARTPAALLSWNRPAQLEQKCSVSVCSCSVPHRSTTAVCLPRNR